MRVDYVSCLLFVSEAPSEVNGWSFVSNHHNVNPLSHKLRLTNWKLKMKANLKLKLKLFKQIWKWGGGWSLHYHLQCWKKTIKRTEMVMKIIHKNESYGCVHPSWWHIRCTFERREHKWYNILDAQLKEEDKETKDIIDALRKVKGKCALGPFLSILVIECQHKCLNVNLCSWMDKVQIKSKGMFLSLSTLVLCTNILV
jgi:hypothetical protein